MTDDRVDALYWGHSMPFKVYHTGGHRVGKTFALERMMAGWLDEAGSENLSYDLRPVMNGFVLDVGDDEYIFGSPIEAAKWIEADVAKRKKAAEKKCDC